MALRDEVRFARGLDDGDDRVVVVGRVTSDRDLGHQPGVEGFVARARRGERIARRFGGQPLSLRQRHGVSERERTAATSGSLAALGMAGSSLLREAGSREEGSERERQHAARIARE